MYSVASTCLGNYTLVSLSNGPSTVSALEDSSSRVVESSVPCGVVPSGPSRSAGVTFAGMSTSGEESPLIPFKLSFSHGLTVNCQ